MYSHDEIERANRTAWEAFESDPVVFEFVKGTANETKLERTLDYGSGPRCLHTWALRKEWIECHPWEFGRNFDPHEHRGCALRIKYNTVMMSNVLNVQSSLSMLARTLGEAGRVVNKPGRLVANYPIHPRLSKVTVEQVIALLAERFSWVVEIDPLLFECYDLSTALRAARRVMAHRVHRGADENEGRAASSGA